MNYDEWADEYLQSAKMTEEKIKEYREKMRKCRNTALIYKYAKKLETFNDMYNDCMYTASQLRKKANDLRKNGLHNIVTV